MPIFTTLEFFRSKQTIGSFDQMYPKSMTGLREAIEDSLETVDNMLAGVTQQYLKGHENHESFIREKAISLHLLISETATEGVYRKLDFELIFDRAGASIALNEHLNKIKELSKDISDYNPNAFTPIVELFEKILSCMEKYFLSFYSGNVRECPNKYIETAFKYETRRLEIIEEIKKNLRRIFNLSNQFNTHGLKGSDMGEKTIHLARRVKSMEMPCFLLFPESCHLIEDSKVLLLQWIEIDKEYAKALKIDMNIMTEEKEELEITKRNEYDNYIKSRHISEQLQRDYDEMFSSRSVMKAKLQKCESDLHETLVKVKHNEMAIKKAEIIFKELQKRITDLGSSENLEKEANEQNYIITKKMKSMKENKTKMKRIETKIKWYNRFIKTLAIKKSQLDSCHESCSKYKIRFEETSEKIASIDEYWNHLHSICLLKSSNSTLKKIFHNLDFRIRLHSLPGGDQENITFGKDKLAEAIKMTSQMIDKDWITLYVNLPFHPPRGTTEIENDIERFTKQQVRGLREDMALQSLNTWRKFHTRSNLTVLVETLQNINRSDILKKMDWLPKSKTDSSVNRIDEEKLPAMSATTRFLIKHYPNLQKSRKSNDSS